MSDRVDTDRLRHGVGQTHTERRETILAAADEIDRMRDADRFAEWIIEEADRMALNRVWRLAWDGNPTMDGDRTLTTGPFDSLERAQIALRVMLPRPNLRIESSLMTEWEKVDDE